MSLRSAPTPLAWQSDFGQLSKTIRQIGIYLVLFGVSLGCQSDPKSEAVPSKAAPSASAQANGNSTPPGIEHPGEALFVAVQSSASRGKALVKKHECSRCHEGTGFQAAPRELHCFSCHEDIARGRFGQGSRKLPGWQETVEHYRYVPSLAHIGKRIRRHWIAKYLHSPTDLRRHLLSNMPRLGLSVTDASDIAHYLTETQQPSAPDSPVSGSLSRGRQLFENKQCGRCHDFSGSGVAISPDLAAAKAEDQPGIRLAPDLRLTRERFLSSALIDWLRDPAAMSSGTRMPNHGLSGADAADLAEFLWQTELKAPVPPVPPKRLPALTRDVSFDEVNEKVLSRTCGHCHTDPLSAGGDGGPGNTGGFGFKPRGLDLSSYRGTMTGHITPSGDRASVFQKTESGEPLLLAAILARSGEQHGTETPGVRGMPLGLPPLNPEQVQLVESWIAQGRRR